MGLFRTGSEMDNVLLHGDSRSILFHTIPIRNILCHVYHAARITHILADTCH